MADEPTNPPAPAAESAEPVASTPPAEVTPEATARASAVERLGNTPAGQALAAALGQAEPAAPEIPSEPAVAPTSDDVLETAPEPEQDQGDEEPEPEEPPVPRNRKERFEARQAAEAARKAEVDAAVASAMAARDEQAKAEQALAARQAEDARVMAEVQAIWAPEIDEQALIDKIAEGDFEAADQLKTVRAGRKQANAIWQAAEKVTFAKLVNLIASAKTLPGVNPAAVDWVTGASPVSVDGVTSVADLFKHVSESAAKATADEWAGKLERQKADYESRLARSAGRMPTTEVGGAPTGGGPAITQAEVGARMRSGDYRWLAEHKDEVSRLARTGQLH